MKKVVLAGLLLSSSSVWAQSCPVSVPNDIHVNDGKVSVYEAGKPKLVIDENNNVFIDGKKLDLNAMQQQAVVAYSNGVQEFLPQMAGMADTGMALASDVMDQVSKSLGSEESFAKVQALIKQYGEQAKAKFYNEKGEFVMPANTFENMDTQWQTEFEQAMKQLSVESMAGLFAALSNEMKNGEINLTEMQSKFSELKTNISEQVQKHSKEMAAQSNQLCTSVEGLAKEENQLQQLIPQLKDIKMFEQ
ncbi:DUF2884 family protein [Photobacterium damselae subsp. damselae]|uniref:YggN family protein n=1 Tax=Photobacterium damselae TaxID=38293 RepID=UPI0010FD9EF2|nr:YggN family protein [Photobacterium damselae]MBA5681781.1 YggN family protein [Photobacterium damselae subsp. damselae]TLS82224.1 DUF2884 family protein [Photobacterium damselae subsp. damselae]TLS89629.1 DUF2884 family protein [Photobacterium damselae subsp. damselae]